MDFNPKRISVVGLGKSGMAGVRFFRRRGMEVFASDSGSPDPKKLEELDRLGVPYETGGNTGKILDADLILVSPGVDANLPLLAEAKKKNIEVWPEIEAAYRFCPGPLVAITGTNGKSTVTALVGHLMSAAGRDARVVGNIGLPLLDEIEGMTAQSWAVMEVSSFQLETITAFRPRIASILNVTEDHLNRHPDFETYTRIKSRILMNQTESDFAVLNKDDPVSRSMASKAKGRVIWFNDREIYVEGNSVVRESGGSREILASFKKFPLAGKHNEENLAASAAICYASGMTRIEKGIETFTGLHHRLEFVATYNGVDFYDDSKGTNPAASAAALASFQKPIVLIAGGYDKNLNFTPMAEAARGKVKSLVALGKDNGKILSAFSFLGKDALSESHEIGDAVRKAVERASPGDLVLLAPGCASFDLFNSAEERGDRFKACVRKLVGVESEA